MTGPVIPFPADLVEVIAQRAAEIIRDRGAAVAPAREYLTVQEAAEYIGAKPKRIYDLTSMRRVRAYKDGSRSLYRRSELDAYLAGETIRLAA